MAHENEVQLIIFCNLQNSTKYFQNNCGCCAARRYYKKANLESAQMSKNNFITASL